MRGLFNEDSLDLFWSFVCERQRVWFNRFVLKTPFPWTEDLTLQAERFTNVYRELDPGTEYVVSNVLEFNADKPDKVFNVMLYRLIGSSETHKALGFQFLESFNPIKMERVLKRVRGSGPVFTGAYMVSAFSQMGSSDKVENVVRLFSLLHENFDGFYSKLLDSTSSESAFKVLKSAFGFGDFLAFQVLVDLRYPLKYYSGKGLLPFSNDDWACAGPGAKRGISLLLKPDKKVNELEVMRWLRDNQRNEFERLNLDFPYLKNSEGTVELSLANVQNCLCEFHKYVKIRNSTGRGRRKFFQPT